MDWQHELGVTLDYYDSVEALKANKTCWRTCGIVQIELTPEGEVVNSIWIVEQNL